MSGTIATLALLCGRELRLSLRQGSDSLVGAGFFLMVVVLFPLGVGPEPERLAAVAAGVIWVAVLLAALLTLDRMFAQDLADGSLDCLLLSPVPLTVIVMAKCLAHWLLTVLPLAIVAPVAGLLLNLAPEALATLVAGLLLGGPVLSLLGAVGAALSLNARRPAVLATLVVLPLQIPILVFAVAGVEAAGLGLPAAPHLLVLAGLLAFALALAPPIAAAALRRAVGA